MTSKLLFLIYLLTVSLQMRSQNTGNTPAKPEVFTIVEEMPEFPGGQKAMYEFVQKKSSTRNRQEGKISQEKSS
jgi:hypothetical protein